MNYVERSEEVTSDEGFLKRVHETVFIGLRKCPKCGASAHTHRLTLDDTLKKIRIDYIDAGSDFYEVRCGQCGKHTKPCITLEGAVGLWNDKR